MKAVVAAFNQEKALVGAFSVIANLRMELFQALMKVVIAGLSNTYTHYVATWEEYQRQRYEAASTIYGPHTLAAYIQQFTHLAQVSWGHVTRDN